MPEFEPRIDGVAGTSFGVVNKIEKDDVSFNWEMGNKGKNPAYWEPRAFGGSELDVPVRILC